MSDPAHASPGARLGRRPVGRPRSGLRRVGVLGASALLLVAGGAGLLAAAFASGPAGADSGSGSAGSGSDLGGFTVSSLAEAVTAQYEQPNFPLPATPSLEFDEGYAATTDNYGPSGTATASSLYPGQVVANAGPELALLVPGVPLPPAPVWPAQAATEYPQTPTASTDEPGVNMDSSSTANGNTASATLGDDAPEAGSSGADADCGGALGFGQPAGGLLGHLRHRHHVGHLVVTGPEHDRQRRGQRDRQWRLHPRRPDHHRQRHLDRHGDLGRRQRQVDRFDPGPEHVDRR